VWVTYKEGGAVPCAIEVGTVTTDDWVEWSVEAACPNWKEVLDKELALLQENKLPLADTKPDVCLRWIFFVGLISK